MRPTVAELLSGIADALTTDVAPHLDDVAARHQIAAATSMLRRLAGLVPQLTPYLLTDAADIATTLQAIAPDVDDAGVRAAIATTGEELDGLDPAVSSLDELHRVHDRLLAVLDDVVARAPSGPGAPALRALLERMVVRERDLGASIAGR